LNLLFPVLQTTLQPFKLSIFEQFCQLFG